MYKNKIIINFLNLNSSVFKVKKDYDKQNHIKTIVFFLKFSLLVFNNPIHEIITHQQIKLRKLENNLNPQFKENKKNNKSVKFEINIKIYE